MIEIDAENALEACSLVDDGSVDVPDFGDPRWRETRSLEHEESTPA